MQDIRTRKIICAMLGFSILLIGVSQLFPWANWKDSRIKAEIYPWAFHGYGGNITGSNEEEYIFFYEFITGGNFTKEIKMGMMAFFLFPMSLITLLLGFISVGTVKKQTVSHLLLFFTIVCALSTLLLFYGFVREMHILVPEAESCFNLGIGFFTFFIGTITFFAMSIYVHYRYYPSLI